MYYLFDVASQNKNYGSLMTTTAAAAAGAATTTPPKTTMEGHIMNGQSKKNKTKKKSLFNDGDNDENDSVRGENLLLLEPTLPSSMEEEERRRRRTQEQFLLDIDEAVQRIGFGSVQIHTIIATGLLLVADAMEVVLLSFLSHVAEQQFDVDDNDDNKGHSIVASAAASAAASAEEVLEDTLGVDGHAADNDGSDSLLRTVVFPAAIAGAVIWGVIGDLYGRRVVLVATSFVVATFGIVTSFVTSFTMLVIVRCAVSFGIGGMSVGFDLCAELLPPNKRGKFLALIQGFWTLGSLIAHLTLKHHTTSSGTQIDENTDSIDRGNGWRWIAGLFAVPSFMALVVTVFLVPDSPRWYLAKGRHDEALSILRKAAEANKKDPAVVFPKGVMLFSHEYSQQHYRYSDFRHNHNNNTDDDNAIHGRRGPNDNIQRRSSFSSYFISCWNRSSLRQVFNLCSAGWMNITAVLWTTYFGKAFLEHGSISMAVDVFSNDNRQQEYQAVFTAASECFGICLVVCLVDEWGRSATQIVFYAMSGVLCLTLALFQDYGSSVNPDLLLGLVFFAHLFVHSGTVTTWIATTEVLATTIRTSGHGTACAVTRIGRALSTFILSRIYSIPTVGLILFVTALWTASSASKLPETKVKDMGAVHYPDPLRRRRRRRQRQQRRQSRQQTSADNPQSLVG